MNEINHPVKVGQPSAIVNGTPLVTLWRNGETIAVPEESVEALSRDGWLTNSPEDLDALVGEIALYAEQVSSNIKDFVHEVRSDGVIDSHDGAVYEGALVSLKLLNRKMSDLFALVHTVYPMRQGQTVTLIDLEGVEREVDPGQVKSYIADGWKQK